MPQGLFICLDCIILFQPFNSAVPEWQKYYLIVTQHFGLNLGLKFRKK